MQVFENNVPEVLGKLYIYVEITFVPTIYYDQEVSLRVTETLQCQDPLKADRANHQIQSSSEDRPSEVERIVLQIEKTFSHEEAW